MAIKSVCLLFGGSLVTFHAFKQSSSCTLCGITNSEVINAINSLEESSLGKVRTVQVRYISNPVTVFIKEEPDKLNWLTDLCSQSDYQARYNQTTILLHHWSLVVSESRERAREPGRSIVCDLWEIKFIWRALQFLSVLLSDHVQGTR